MNMHHTIDLVDSARDNHIIFSTAFRKLRGSFLFLIKCLSTEMVPIHQFFQETGGI